jgi:hypothetical protein
MFRSIIGLFLLASCSMGEVKTGGEKTYVYNPKTEYFHEELKELSREVIETSVRQPPKGKLEELFSKNRPPLKRVGIIVFETLIQPTRDGLAGEDKIYLSEAGKQLLTEKLFSIWNQGFPLIAPHINYVNSSHIKDSKSLSQFGLEVEDHLKTNRAVMAPDDIFYLPKGKKTPIATVMNPRGMRDLSFMLVPAYDLMKGPKWSEHNKHYVNAMMRELDLDAALIVMSELSWTSSRMEKNSGEHIPEEMNVKISSTVLVSAEKYRERLEKLGKKDNVNVTLAYRSFEGELKAPVNMNYSEESFSYELIIKEILNPAVKTYRDLSIMMMERINEELKKTH